jgi:hypothetical protein
MCVCAYILTIINLLYYVLTKLYYLQLFYYSICYNLDCFYNYGDCWRLYVFLEANKGMMMNDDDYIYKLKLPHSQNNVLVWVFLYVW